MSASRNVEELLRQAEQYHEQYMKTLQAVLEIRSPSPGAAQGLGVRMERAGSNDGAPSPMVKAISFEERLPTRAMTAGSDGSFSHGLFRRPRRLTNEMGEAKRPGIQPLAAAQAGSKASRPSSVFTQEVDYSDEDVEFLQLTSPNATQPQPHMILDDDEDSAEEYLSLPHESFTLEQLVSHLQGLDEGNEVMAKALGDMWDHRGQLDTSNVIDEGDLDTHPTYEVYDIDHEGLAIPQHEKNDDTAEGGVEAATVWETLKEVSSEGATGRITTLQEPSPLMLGAAHMTMSRHFDMDELYGHLITAGPNKGKTRAYVDRAFEATPLRRRTFFFVFKYFTVVGEGLKSAPWQKFDYRPPDRRSMDHIDITECSSVLALSLEGEPIEKLTRKDRRQRKKQAEEGYVYHPFAPWHLLSIQCFPDNAHSLRSEDLGKQFVSGPYAFLDTLAAEYRDAVKRYTRLNEMITKLITPPSEFMFDVKLRDKLLFEDANFTYSRRYFWAYNSLGVINDGIKSMRSAYFDTFKDDFWLGRNRTVWPYPYPHDNSASKVAYERLMAGVRQDLEKAVLELDVMHKKNERTRNEIFSLREQLFSGSSVRESRRAIEQGDNIKILTGVSMLFLPLTFVTSVFGITTLDIQADDWRFPVTMVTVCVPFFVLIFVLQTRAGVRALSKSGKFLDKAVSRVFGGHRHQMQQHQGAGIDHGSQMYPGPDARRRRRRKGLKRTQSGFQSVVGTVAGTEERRGMNWYRFPWRRRKVREEGKEIIV
ncbi:hypothetical protein GE09DRAFT_240775 [Coniochaeta sp. 2T2.1]|nr:hypothetical protein GE09DRAFT_240775 [Coniochaeta sp. 2T2.1]